MFKNILTTVVIIFALILSGAVQAKKVTPISTETAGGFLRACMAEDDQENKRNSGAWGCCSKKLDYCVACPTWPNSGSCVITSYKKGGQRNLMNQLTAPTAGTAIAPTPKPPSLRDRLKQQQTTTPAKVMSPAKTPTVTPIKEYKQIKAPTKAVQTTGK